MYSRGRKLAIHQSALDGEVPRHAYSRLYLLHHIAGSIMNPHRHLEHIMPGRSYIPPTGGPNVSAVRNVDSLSDRKSKGVARELGGYKSGYMSIQMRYEAPTHSSRSYCQTCPQVCKKCAFRREVIARYGTAVFQHQRCASGVLRRVYRSIQVQPPRRERHVRGCTSRHIGVSCVVEGRLIHITAR